MTERRNNHYVPEWYQKGFLSGSRKLLHHFDLCPDQKILDDRRVITMNAYRIWPASKCFVEYDLYTTFLGGMVSDKIESILFGDIDDKGARAVRAFATNNPQEWHKHFQNFFEFIDAQKIRTPKGLSWIKKHYFKLNQNELMNEMANIRNMHATLWTEGVREIVSAENSEIKFIISDHPVTTYNYALPPNAEECQFPNDPDIALKATQTIFPLDLNHCLILTNLEYAKGRDDCAPLEKRTYAQNFRRSLVRTDHFIDSRKLTAREVSVINNILKNRARRFIAAGEKEWLFPENATDDEWADFRHVLMPPGDTLKYPGGEMYVGYEDGHSDFQDAFGRRNPENKYLRKKIPKKKLKPKQLCGCGSGRQFRHCCKGKKESQRPSWTVLSIRERNMALCRGIRDILGFEDGKDWNDVRKSFSNEQVKRIFELYSFLWPAETEFMDLLPKPDNKLKAIYTGIIDPRVTPQNAISLSLYFDEIFIQSPFVNPNSVKPKFSPIENPSQYRRDALKHIFLLLELEPFIDAGFINVIPDICNFDFHLQRQMLDMAEQRSKLLPMDDDDIELIQKLNREDFKRSMYMLPKNVLKQQIRKHVSDIDDQGVEAVLEYIEHLLDQDPFALIEDNEQSDGEGHLMMFNLAPNFEISLFLAQVTGSVLLTDNMYRWKEILNTQLNSFIQQDTGWESLLAEANSIKFPVNAHAFRTLDLRLQGKFERMRLALKNLCRVIKSDTGTKNKNKAAHNIMNQLKSAEEIALSENDASPISQEFERFYDKEMQNHCSLKFFAPKGGIQHQNTQRMLLSRGGLEHLDHVPIAIFVEHEWEY